MISRFATGIALITLIAAFPRPAASQDVGLAIGAKPAPVVLEDLDGKPVDLAQYMGKKPMMVEFWATWCPVCEELQPSVIAAHKTHSAKVQFVIIGVGVSQTPRTIKRHLEKTALPGLFLFDRKGAAVRAFDAPATSYVVVLDASGKVTYTGSGSDQNLEAALAKVSAPAKRAPARTD